MPRIKTYLKFANAANKSNSFFDGLFDQVDIGRNDRPVENKNPLSVMKYNLVTQQLNGSFGYRNMKANILKTIKEKKEIELNQGIKNTNTTLPIEGNVTQAQIDWPGMHGMQAPTPADGPGIATGNGPGSEIFARNQVKNAAENGNEAAEDYYKRQAIAYMQGQMQEPYRTRGGTPILRAPGLSLTEIGRKASGPLNRAANILGKPIQAVNYFADSDSVWPGILAGGAILGGIGALSGLGYNKWKKRTQTYEDPRTGEEIEFQEDPDRPEWKDILAGTALGIGGGGALGYLLKQDHDVAKHFNKKYSSVMSPFGPPVGFGPDPLTIINAKIMSDNNLTFEDRRSLMNYVSTIPTDVLQQIVPGLSSLIGAGAGALIARKLLNMGFAGTILGALIGSHIGGGLGNSYINNMPPAYNPLRGMGFVDTYGNELYNY